MDKVYELDKNNIPKELEDELIKKAVEKLEVMYFTENEREIYESERKFRMDRQEEVRTAEKKGLKQGVEQGRKEEKLEIAKKLLEILDDETIAQKTGLAIEEIIKLRKE